MNDADKTDEKYPLVSIIVPVYNTERYLKQCIDSLLHQTLEDIEIIIIDDGSTDSSPAMCDAFSVQDPRVRVIHQKNSGYGKACNVGIDAARGEFFGIIEADDYAEPEMFKSLENAARLHTLDVVRCHYYEYKTWKNTHERVELSHIPHNTVYSPRDVLIAFNQAPAVWTMLMRREFILENNIRFMETPGASYQDTSFCFKVFASADRFMLTDDTLIHYRMDNVNSSSLSKEKVFYICDEYKEIERFMKERGLYEKLMPIFPKIKFLSYVWNYKRLSKRNRWIFLMFFSNEMRKHISERRISGEIYTARDIFKIYLVAFCFPLYHFLMFLYKT